MIKGKRIVKLAIGLLFIVLAGWIVIKAVNKEAEGPIEYLPAIPDIDLIDAYYNAVSLDSLASGAKHYILIFFSPWCMFCEHEAADISRNRVMFTDSRVLFITQEPIDSAMAYGLRYNLITADNFFVLADTTYSVLQRFGIKSMPTTLIYDENRVFFTSCEGEVNTKKILKIIRGE